MKVTVYITNLSGERLWDIEKGLPSQVQIGVNINILGLESRSESLVEAPFVLTINYAPPVAQINIKGRAHIAGEKTELEKVLAEQKEQKPASMPVIQAISNSAMAEAILMSKTLGVPPPIPPIGTMVPQGASKPDVRYTS